MPIMADDSCLQHHHPAARPASPQDDIYTFAGPVLIALNPCKKLPLYTTEVANQYKGTLGGCQVTSAIIIPAASRLPQLQIIMIVK